MNIRKIIREEMDNSLQWIMDVKSYPTLQQLFDKGEIKEGDVLVLRGEVQSDDERGEITWVNDFTVTINSEGERLNKTGFDLDPNEIDAKKAMGLSDHINVTFLKSDGNLEVIRKNNKSTQLTESDDLDWIRDVNPQLPKDRDWWLINDIDPYSLEVSWEIQQFLFDQEFAWISGRRKFLPERFWVVSHRGETHSEQSGKFSYYLPKRPKKMKQDIKAMEALGEVYYWSQLKSDSLNESNELDWIRDIEAGDLWTPYVGMKFIITDGSEDVIYHILNINDEEGWMYLKWKDNKSGEEEDFGYYMEDYYRMVEEDRIQIVHDNLNESEDLQWIKDINPIPELKVGSCFIDTMDPAQRKWVIIDFRNETGTPIIVVKNNIDSMYMHQEYFEQDLFNGRYKPCQR